MSSNLERGLIEVGYYLSRLGIDQPPIELNARTWKEAYSKFYGTFGLGKTEDEFRNSLKNIRDHFDSHLNNERVGWRDEDKLPQQLPSLNQEVFDELQKISDVKLWSIIKLYATTIYDSSISEPKVLKVKKYAKFFSSEFSGKKNTTTAKMPAYSVVYHGLIVDKLKEYIETTIENSFAYNTQKIDLVLEINGVLNRIFEVKTSTDTQSIYTAVGQLFMHTAGTIDIEKWIVLPGPIKNTELDECMALLGISILWFQLKDNNCKFEFDSLV